MAERWLPVPGYEDFYEVSDLGRVRSLDRTIETVNGSGPCTKVCKGKLLRLSDSGSAPGVTLCDGSSQRRAGVAHLVLLAFGPPRPPDGTAWHRDGDYANNRIGNLVWRTPDYVSEHLARVRPSKLSRAQMLEVLERRRGGETVMSLVRSFGVSKCCISRVLRREGA